jgi:hypothetical protein
MGELRGIALTPELRDILLAVLALPQRRQPMTGDAITTTTNENSIDSPPDLESEDCNNANNDDARVVGPQTTTPIISRPYPRMTVTTATSILNASIVVTPASFTTTSTTIPNAIDNVISDNSPHIINLPTLSLEGVIAAKFLIDVPSVHENNNNVNNQNCNADNRARDHDHRRHLLHRLETALRSSTLSFEPSNSNANATTSSSNKHNNKSASTTTAFAKRLERLRLHSEERSYSRLTTNIQHPAAYKSADDVTVKSMTYAASVGLNMIVGPLAFGTFMYFFAGGILDRFFSNNNTGGGGVDVRRVIAGVISGAFMLFVEMILFVIRSHELDASVRKKGKRAEYRANPFGYTQKSMARTYIGD